MSVQYYMIQECVRATTQLMITRVRGVGGAVVSWVTIKDFGACTVASSSVACIASVSSQALQPWTRTKRNQELEMALIQQFLFVVGISMFSIRHADSRLEGPNTAFLGYGELSIDLHHCGVANRLRTLLTTVRIRKAQM